jgi:hypothetical protein
MKKTFLIILFYFYSNYAFSCVCGSSTLIERFQKSEFVAKVRILKITNIENDFDYQNAAIEVLDLYKGEKLQTIKILYAINSSCSFYVPENSIWLVFADTYNGKLSFGYCSGSKQIDRDFNSKEYPNAQENYDQSIQRKLSILNILKENKVNDFNENDLWIIHTKKCESDFKGFEVNDNNIALYEIKVNSNLKIKKVKALKEFDNVDLSKEILKCLSKNIIIDNKKIKKIPQKTKIYIAYYFYEKDNQNESFISEIDL